MAGRFGRQNALKQQEADWAKSRGRGTTDGPENVDSNAQNTVNISACYEVKLVDERGKPVATMEALADAWARLHG